MEWSGSRNAETMSLTTRWGPIFSGNLMEMMRITEWTNPTWTIRNWSPLIIVERHSKWLRDPKRRSWSMAREWMKKRDMSLVTTFQEKEALQPGTMLSSRISSTWSIKRGVERLDLSVTTSAALSRKMYRKRKEIKTCLHGMIATITLRQFKREKPIQTTHACKLMVVYGDLRMLA